MTTDNKTLADVKPGGRVRLGDQPWPEIDAILADAYSAGAVGLPFEGIARRAAVREAVAAVATNSPSPQEPVAYQARKVIGDVIGHWHAISEVEYKHFNEFPTRTYEVRALYAALSAQPSPGGQDALLESLVARWRNHAEEIGVSDNLLCQKIANCTMRHAAELQAVLAARQPVSESPMAKMAAALRGKAEAEKAAFDQRVQSGEWGPMPDQYDTRSFCAVCDGSGWKDASENELCPVCEGQGIGTSLAARQPVGEPVAVVGPDFQLFWFGSGPISPLVERNGLRPGSKLYASPAQAVDLGGIPEGWRLSKKATCYQLSHGDHIIGNLVGPDAEENAAIIARVLDSHSAGGKP